MLFDYVKRGGQAVLGDMGVDFRSGMPAFADVLSDAEIEAILGYPGRAEMIHRDDLAISAGLREAEPATAA